MSHHLNVSFQQYLMDPERIPEFLSSSNGADQDACFEYGDDCSLTAECCENGRRVTPAPSPEPSTTPAPSTFLVEPSSSPSSKPTSSPSIGGEYKVTCNETAQCDRLDLNLAEVPNGFSKSFAFFVVSTELPTPSFLMQSSG